MHKTREFHFRTDLWEAQWPNGNCEWSRLSSLGRRNFDVLLGKKSYFLAAFLSTGVCRYMYWNIAGVACDRLESHEVKGTRSRYFR